MKLTKAKFEFKIQDLWIGVFWKTTPIILDNGPKTAFIDVWICPLPCFPLHLTFLRTVVIPFNK